MRRSLIRSRRCAGAVRRRHSRPGQSGWKRRICSSVAQRLPDDDGLLALEPNFKTLTSPASISFDSDRLNSSWFGINFCSAVLEFCSFLLHPVFGLFQQERLHIGGDEARVERIPTVDISDAQPDSSGYFKNLD